MFGLSLSVFAKIILVLSLIMAAIGTALMICLTGHTFFGLALVGIAAVLVFSVWCSAMHASMPHLVSILRWIVYGVLTLGVVYFCFVEAQIISDAKTETDQGADVLIVLGAGVNGSVPSLSLHDRLVGTLDYLESHPDCVAVLSGGQGPDEDITEAKCMYDWLVDAGISPDRLLQEDKATSTLENLQFSKAIIDADSRFTEDSVIGVVSSEYHLHRAKLLAEHLHIPVIGVAAKTSYPTVCINYFIREAFAMTEIYVFGVR